MMHNIYCLVDVQDVTLVTCEKLYVLIHGKILILQR